MPGQSQTADDVDNINITDEAENVYAEAIGSQFDRAQQDAENEPDMLVYEERAHVEITHVPAEPANPPQPRVPRRWPRNSPPSRRSTN
jgi:hypothetical protein